MSKASVPKTQAGRVAKPSFCSSCIMAAVDLVPRGIGRLDGIVWLCHDCDTLHPRSGRYRFDGPEAPDRGTAPGTRQRNPGGRREG